MNTLTGCRAITVGDRLSELARVSPATVAYEVEDWRITYGELNHRAEAVASRFRALGASKGDRIAILTSTRAEWFEIFFGLAKLGAIQVPLNAFLRGEFLRFQLEDSTPAFVISDEAGRAAIQPLLHQLSSVKALVLLDGLPPEADGEALLHDYNSLPMATEDASEAVLPTDTMSILYTSGTTGLPKGCVLSHGYYSRCGQVDAGMLDIVPTDRFITAMPLFHGGGQLKILMPCLMAGIPLIVEPSFSPTRFFRRISETNATLSNGVGAMGTMLLGSPTSNYDRKHSLRTMNIAPFTEADQLAFGARFGADAWAESYGQTECVPVLSNSPSGLRDRMSNGSPVSDIEVLILDDELNPVDDGEVGEICLRPRHRFAMFDGYWNRPEETLKAFAGLWYHTGDFGKKLPSGSIAFVDRKKDALRRRGENVSSIELEAAIRRHDAVDEVAVHAVRSDLGEDDIKACIVLSGQEPAPHSLFEWLRENLPYFAIPRYVEFIDILPKNHAGRVLKHLLRERPITTGTWDFQALGLTVSRDQRR
ncbi:AMP-binding protein [Specibacter sp. RAF43]|uniref:AMP-binding protein n=1 Tax=Specibacter sp. RAF43 TaxID=3233057 RepID=UPI003F9BC263